MPALQGLLPALLVASCCLTHTLAGQVKYKPINSLNPDQRPWMDNHMATTLHEFRAVDIDRQEISFLGLAGKVVLVTNVASACGYTEGHYEGFRELNKQFGEDLVIMAWPCNQFNKQEPGLNEEIKEFADSRGFSGMLMDKIHVNGANMQHPVYKFLKEASREPQPIDWNFVKFLVGKDGTVRGRFPPQTSPQDLSDKIEALVREELR